MKMTSVGILILCLVEFSLGYYYNSTPASDFQPLFQLQQNGPWIGSDVFTSVNLGNNSDYLWLLGDTLTGKIVNNKRVETAMPRNAIAMMKKEPNLPPSPLEFHIRYDPNNKNSGFFTPKENSDWFWPISGCVINSKLYLFAYFVYTNGSGAFGFAFHGTAVITVSNPFDNPDSWIYSYVVIPDTDNDLLWGVATIVVEDYLYLLGFYKSDTVLSRILLSNVVASRWDLLEKWSYPSAGSPSPSWNMNPTGSLASLFTKIPETTIQYHPYLSKYFVLDIPFLGDEILISWSDMITGPWSAWELIYKIPYPWNDSKDGIFCYAPKSHPQFTKAPNEIILTYASNAPSIFDLVDELSIYDPQIIRVLVSKV